MCFKLVFFSDNYWGRKGRAGALDIRRPSAHLKGARLGTTKTDIIRPSPLYGFAGGVRNRAGVGYTDFRSSRRYLAGIAPSSPPADSPLPAPPGRSSSRKSAASPAMVDATLSHRPAILEKSNSLIAPPKLRAYSSTPTSPYGVPYRPLSSTKCTPRDAPRDVRVVILSIFPRSAAILGIPGFRFPAVDFVRSTNPGFFSPDTSDSDPPRTPAPIPSAYRPDALFASATFGPLWNLWLKSSGYNHIMELPRCSSVAPAGDRSGAVLRADPISGRYSPRGSAIPSTINIEPRSSVVLLAPFSSPQPAKAWSMAHLSPAPPAFLSSTTIHSSSTDGALVYQPAECLFINDASRNIRGLYSDRPSRRRARLLQKDFPRFKTYGLRTAATFSAPRLVCAKPSHASINRGNIALAFGNSGPPGSSVSHLRRFRDVFTWPVECARPSRSLIMS